jgi:alkylhydroperoxidase family enzyme
MSLDNVSFKPSRIAPLDPPYAPDIQEQFDRIMRGAPPLMLFRVMAGHARAWDKFRAGGLLDRGPLNLRQREIVIDRTCALTACEYEWGVHVATFAEAAHLTNEEVRATVHEGAGAPCWSEAEQAMIAAVDALHHRATLSDQEYSSFSAHYDDDQILPAVVMGSGFAALRRPGTTEEGRRVAIITSPRPAADRADAGCPRVCRLRSRPAW